MEKDVPVRAVCRAISMLKVINRNGSMTMMEIARATNVAYPTAYRIVQTLIYEGLVELESARKSYRVTALVESLSSGFKEDGRLIKAARNHIVDLTKRVGWPVSITVRVGRNMILRDSTHANTSLTFDHYHPGFTLPLLDSASGKLSMAYASDEDRRSILNWLRASQEFDLEYLDLAETRLEVDHIREVGYALQGRNIHNRTPGKTGSIAVPIFCNGEFVAALTMIFFVSSMKIYAAVERYLDDLQTTATLIGDELSLMPEPTR